MIVQQISERGADQTNQFVGVLSQFRPETVGMVADIIAVFHQGFVDPKDCEAVRFYGGQMET